MRKDAEMHAEEDLKKKELIESKNMADSLIFTTEKALKEAGDKISEEKKKPVVEKIEALKKAKDGDDVEALKKAIEEMNAEAGKIGQELYEAAKAAEQKKEGDSSQPGDKKDQDKKDEGDVSDAEVTDDKDKK